MLAIAIGLLLTVAVAVCIVMVVALPYMRNGSRILTPDGERVVERVREQAVQKPVAAAGTTWSGLVAAREKAAKAWEPASTALHEKLDRLEAPRAEGPQTGSIDLTDGAPRDIRAVEGRPESEGVPAAAHLSAPAPATRPMALHQPAAGSETAPVAPVVPAAPAAPARRQERFDLAAITGNRPAARQPIGAPRPVPPISGPIPVEVRSDAGAPADRPEPGQQPVVAGDQPDGSPAGSVDQVIDLRTEEAESSAAPASGTVRPAR